MKRIKSMDKSIYKKWWFWVIVVLVIGVFGNMGNGDKKNANTKNNDTKKTEISRKKTKSTNSDKKKLTVEIADSFETDAEGNVTIAGKTEPKAKVQIGFGVINDPAEADDSGNFTLTYSLTSAKDKKINIRASLEGNSESKGILIKPSTEYIASEKSNDTSDITVKSEKPTPNQEIVLLELAQQQFDKQFPYKGSKMQSVLGIMQNWTVSDERWFYKVNATIVNAYGAKQEANVEVYITPTSASSGNVEIIAY